MASVFTAGCTAPPSLTNEPPVASFELPKHVVEIDELVVLNGSLSFDREGHLLVYAWNFGDGTTEVGALVSHRYAAAGLYAVTLTVADEQGAQNTQAENLTVNAPPLAYLDAAPGPYFAKSDIAFSGALSRDDDGRIDAYLWTFGDGQTAAGPTVSHAFSQEGTFTVILTVLDNHGARDSASLSLFVDLHTYDVEFAESSAQHSMVRNFTLANATKTLTLEIFPANLTLVHLVLEWIDPMPLGGPPNDVLQIRVLSPDGPSQTVVGTELNLTLDFNLNAIPSPVQVRAASPGDVPSVLGQAYVGVRGIGVWVVEVTALDLVGGFVDGGFVPEPFVVWSLTTTLTTYEAVPTPIA